MLGKRQPSFKKWIAQLSINTSSRGIPQDPKGKALQSSTNMCCRCLWEAGGRASAMAKKWVQYAVTDVASLHPSQRCMLRASGGGKAASPNSYPGSAKQIQFFSYSFIENKHYQSQKYKTKPKQTKGVLELEQRIAWNGDHYPRDKDEVLLLSFKQIFLRRQFVVISPHWFTRQH